MSEDDSRKTLGVIPISKLQNFKEFKAWQSASENFSKAKQASATAKNQMRELIRKRVPLLKDEEDIEFLMSASGTDITVFRSNKKTASRSRKVEELTLE